MMRVRHVLAGGALLATSLPRDVVAGTSSASSAPAQEAAASASTPDACLGDEAWPLWKAYVRRFVQKDGRVVDHTGGGHSTSEGQAYAMLHALVAGDRTTFEAALGWMRDNLAQGDLTAHLPAWKWGKREDGTWGVIDENAASDADLWAAYALLEAGRLWNAPAYTAEGRGLLALIVEREVVEVPGLGTVLLPGPVGFHPDETTWRLNPSYTPLQVLRYLAIHGDPDGPWAGMATTFVAILEAASPHGFVADWLAFRSDEGITVDPEHGPRGSYDAIRTYLWAGMLHDDDPYKAEVATSLRGLYQHFHEHRTVPERVDARLGVVFRNEGNVGFFAALLPEVIAMGRPAEIAELTARIDRERTPAGLHGRPPSYYEQNLVLFGTGFAEGRFSFDADGRLHPRWSVPCQAPTP